MGDYILNYVLDPVIPLADAVAASAAYPGLIGPLILKTSDFEWSRFVNSSENKGESFTPKVKYIHLWDGGVYDNLGVEALFKPSGKKFRNEYNFLIVSDASRTMKVEELSFLHRRVFRLINIATDQVRSLRARSLVNHFTEQPNSGVYLKIGNTARYILEQAGRPEDEIASLAESCLSEDDVKIAANLATTLHRISEEEFDRIYRHGWEVTKCTLLSRCPSLFNSHREVVPVKTKSDQLK
jgi:NTE family protein